MFKSKSRPAIVINNLSHEKSLYLDNTTRANNNITVKKKYDIYIWKIVFVSCMNPYHFLYEQ